MAHASATVAGIELRRTVRAVVGSRTKLLTVAVVALVVLGPMTAVGLFLLPELGEQAAAASLTADTAVTVTEYVTGGVAVLWVFLVMMSIMRTVTTVADVDEPAFLLLSTAVRNTVVGIVAAETALYAAVLLPFTVLFAAAFASGAGTVLPVLVAPLLVSLLLLTAIPVGFVVGIWVRHLITVYEPVARYRTLLFAAFWVVYFGAIATGGLNTVMWSLFTTLQTSPLGWPGHLLLVGVPGIDPSTVGIVGAVAGSALLVGVAFVAGVPPHSATGSRIRLALTTRRSTKRHRPTDSPASSREPSRDRSGRWR